AASAPGSRCGSRPGTPASPAGPGASSGPCAAATKETPEVPGQAVAASSKLAATEDCPRPFRPCSGDDLDPGVLVEGEAAQLAVVPGEVDAEDDDVVLGDAVGGQPGGQEVDRPEGALGAGVPARVADAHGLRDADAPARRQALEQGGQLGPHPARR